MAGEHSQQQIEAVMIDSSRTRACCFALSLLGLMRMLSKNLDESIGMTVFDTALRNASSLDNAIARNCLFRDASLMETRLTTIRNRRNPADHDESPSSLEPTETCRCQACSAF